MSFIPLHRHIISASNDVIFLVAPLSHGVTTYSFGLECVARTFPRG